MANEMHSTGRGGAGNIGRDDTPYADGEIVREGPAGSSFKQDFSTGRGGAGNVVHSPNPGAQQAKSQEQDVVPEMALREAHDDYHTGRGGEGNVHREKYGGHTHDQSKESMGDKIKHALHLDGKKEQEK